MRTKFQKKKRKRKKAAAEKKWILSMAWSVRANAIFNSNTHWLAQNASRANPYSDDIPLRCVINGKRMI